MTLFLKTSFIFFLIVLVLPGCKDKSNPGSPGNSDDTASSLITVQTDSVTLKGKILDEQGNPLSGVAVHYTFELKPKSLSKITNTCPSTVINYTLPGAAHVKIQILRWYTREILEVISDANQEAGAHSAILNLNQLTNGFYIYQFIVDKKVTERAFYIINTDNAILYNSKPLTTSNQDGNFALPRGIFAIGYPSVRTDEAGTPIETLYVSSTIKILLNKTGYNRFEKTIDLNTVSNTEEQFVMSKAR